MTTSRPDHPAGSDQDRTQWDHPDHSRFARDMKDAGLEVRPYRGRFFWEGPAVYVSDVRRALDATSVPCQYDHMGLDWVVYPRAHAAEREAERSGLAFEGHTIRLVRCDDPHTRLRPGLTGVVTLVDGTGTVHVLWEDGHRLGLIPGIDAWEVVDA